MHGLEKYDIVILICILVITPVQFQGSAILASTMDYRAGERDRKRVTCAIYCHTMLEYRPCPAQVYNLTPFVRYIGNGGYGLTKDRWFSRAVFQLQLRHSSEAGEIKSYIKFV